MSFDHPNAALNNCGRNTDPFDLLDWQQRHETIAPKKTPIQYTNLWAELFQWKRIKEDIIHFTPFDSLPKEERDAIRARRLRAFQESHIPWIVTDFTGLMQGIDDIDDMGKTVQFVKEYAIAPIVRAAELVGTLAKDGPRGLLDDLRAACDIAKAGRDRKLAFLRLNGDRQVGATKLSPLFLLFPLWKFVALGLQALQTLDSFFGVGIQLGPLLGTQAEIFFRNLHDLGLPFGPENNKYNQILAARITHRSNFLNAAHQALHPEDQLTALAAAHRASTHDFMPYMVIPPEMYPKSTELFHQPETQLRNYVRIAQSLPYNLTAAAVNNFIAPMFDNWSTALNGVAPPTPPAHVANSLERRVLGLTEKDICPGTNCNATIFTHFAAENTVAQRLDPISHQLIDAYHYFKSLLWHVTPPVTYRTTV